MSQIKVYVGEYRYRPRGVEELPDDLRRVHPKNFERLNHPPVLDEQSAFGRLL